MACLIVRRNLFDCSGPGCHRLYFGIQYGNLWGHRSIMHPLLFACLLSAAFVAMWYRRKARAAQVGIFVYLFLCTALHGVLDALTDGGLGVAFFSPFDTRRYFFLADRLPSPISINDFFSEDAFHVLTSEVKWIWFPTITGFFIIRGLLYVRSAQLAVKQAREDRPAPCADTGVPLWPLSV